MDRRELVERAGRGDPDAFAVLVTASATRLDAAARLILRDPELARDAIQNAMVRAWRVGPASHHSSSKRSVSATTIRGRTPD